MRVSQRSFSLFALLAVGLAACGGQPPPVETAPPPDTTPAVNQDSIEAAARAAERARMAAELCSDAEAAMAAGNYDRARALLNRARNEFGGTDCAARAGDMLARIDAIQTINERIHFEFDRSRITDQAAGVLQRKAEVLRDHPDLQIVIAGHCDERGSLEYNQALGQRRAESTKRYLVNLGLPESMFSTVSYGEERPIAQGSTEAAWAQNRRSEFQIQNPGAL